MSEEWKAQNNKIRPILVFGVHAQENSGGTPEARSRLCVLSGFLPHDHCHGWDSSHWLPAVMNVKGYVRVIMTVLISV